MPAGTSASTKPFSVEVQLRRKVRELRPCTAEHLQCRNHAHVTPHANTNSTDARRSCTADTRPVSLQQRQGLREAPQRRVSERGSPSGNLRCALRLFAATCPDNAHARQRLGALGCRYTLPPNSCAACNWGPKPARPPHGTTRRVLKQQSRARVAGTPPPQRGRCSSASRQGRRHSSAKQPDACRTHAAARHARRLHARTVRARVPAARRHSA